MLQRTCMTILLLGTCLTGRLAATEVSASVDKNRAEVGKPIVVTVTIRQSASKPVVQAPSIPDCTLEQQGGMVAGASAPPKVGSGRSARNPANTKHLTDAIAELENRTNEMLRQNGGPSGFGGGGMLTKEYQDMLRSYRQQALEALNGPLVGSNGLDYQVRYKLVAQRGGILTLPGFTIESGGKTYVTKPIELTFDETAVAPAMQTSPRMLRATPQRPSLALPTTGDTTSFSLSSWLTRERALFALAIVGLLFVGWVAFLTARSLRLQRLLPQPTPAVQRRSPPVAIPELRPGSAPEIVLQALVGYVRSKCQVPAGEVTPHEAVQALVAARVTPGLAEQFGAIHAAALVPIYAPGGGQYQDEDLAVAARRVIAAMDRS